MWLALFQLPGVVDNVSVFDKLQIYCLRIYFYFFCNYLTKDIYPSWGLGTFMEWVIKHIHIVFKPLDMLTKIKPSHSLPYYFYRWLDCPF